MKKIILVLAAALCFMSVSNAQPKSIGARLGYGLVASYEHYIGEPNFLEVNAGFWNMGINFTGTYNFVFAQPDWTTKGQWSWYAGPGISLGTAHFKGDDGNFFFGLLGQVGLEYRFWFPLELSADLRPTVGICDGKFYNSGLFLGFLPAISVRYSF